jgi:hypothetical protein
MLNLNPHSQTSTEEENYTTVHCHMSTSTVCPFCLDDIGPMERLAAMSDKCSHQAHLHCYRHFRDCATESTQLRCPMCRSESNEDAIAGELGIVMNTETQWLLTMANAGNFKHFEEVVIGHAYQVQSNSYGKDPTAEQERKFIEHYSRHIREAPQHEKRRKQLHLAYFDHVLSHATGASSDTARMQLRCLQCLRPPCASSRLRRCSVCRVMKYCSTACQNRHWEQHKDACGPEPAHGSFISEIWLEYCTMLLHSPVFSSQVILHVSCNWQLFSFHVADSMADGLDMMMLSCVPRIPLA